MNYTPQLQQILENSLYLFSDIKPSLWYEENMVMPPGSARPGRFSFDYTPYCREPLDCIAKDHPAKIIAIMKGVQVGFSSGVLTPGIGYTISENPGNILFMTGHAELTVEAVLKVDTMIDNCGLRPLIKPNILRAKNSRTGDTNTSKEYPGGSMVSGGVGNHNLLRQRDIMVALLDDIDAAKQSSKSAGDTVSLAKKRLAAYYNKMKLYLVSTPELKQNSNIEPAFMLGDQRYYHVPCPCCGELIVWYWTVPIEGTDRMAGITYKLGEDGRLINDSVGYICQKCEGFFDDSNKMELLREGKWIPTAIPSEEGYYSYHLSALYAPHGMYDWKKYVIEYIAANPIGQPVKKELMKTFTNTVLGLTWEESGESNKATELMKNIRNYEVGTIPEAMSLKDGNGKIVLLTCACDLNGTLDDARLDFEVTAWSESATSYSVTQGSIGTFIPGQTKKQKEEDTREKWSYENYSANNVWKELDKILETKFVTDTDRPMKIIITGIDTGYCELQAFTYIDNSNFHIVGLKGKGVDEFVKTDANARNFNVGLSRNNLYLLGVNYIKDDLSHRIKLKWDIKNDTKQPAEFMNFPMPRDTQYQFNTYFAHFEAEHKILDPSTNKFVWQKKNSTVQNHLFDCHIYNMAVKEILVFLFAKEMKDKTFDWIKYCKMVTNG